MKKIIALILVSVLCLGMLASCNLIKDAGLEGAAEYINEIYKDKNGTAPLSDFDVVAKAKFEDKFYNVTWTVDSDKIAIKESTKTGYYTVDLPDNNPTKFDYTLTATVANEKGKTVEVKFNLTMPEINTISIPDALAAEDGTAVVVRGTVFRIDTPWNDGYKNISVTIKDSNGNELYLYRLGTNVELGDDIIVTGEIGSYNGKKQVAQGATAQIVGHTDITITYAEKTIPEVLAAEDGVAVKVTGTVCKIVTEWSADYGNISVNIKDDAGNELYLYRLSTNVALGDVIVVEGYVGSYKGAKQIAQGATAKITDHVDIQETPDSGSTGSGNENTGSAIVASDNAVIIADYADANSWENSKQYTTITLVNGATVTAAGTPNQKDDGTYYDTNTGKYYTNGENWRIYQTETPSVVITAAEGKTIATVRITYNIKNTGTLTLNGNNVASGEVVTVNAASITFSVGNTGTATNGQAQITAIEVIYAD